MANPTAPTSSTNSGDRCAALACFLAVCVAFPASVLVATYRAEGLDAAPLPDDYTHHAISVPEHHARILRASERVGEGLLPSPEDLAYDGGAGLLYTGCDDGWIRRVQLRAEGAEAVEKWVYVGGRPLGLAFGPDKQLVVADAYKGLLTVGEDGAVRLLAEEAEGLRFGLTDGVDVASDGSIYFTDATHKYNLSRHTLDIMEGRPHGRLLRFDPATNTTTVLLRDLYFPNGVAVSPDQASLVFCESPLRRCRRYHLAGEKRGTVERFLQNLPGFPDNIRYDGEGHFWIALSGAKGWIWDVAVKYPWVRKMMGLAMQLRIDVSMSHFMKGSGVLRANLEGEGLALYTDPDLALVTGGVKIGRHLYYVSLLKHHIARIPLGKLVTGDQVRVV